MVLGADLVELRLDLLQVSDIKQLKRDLQPFMDRSIITVRSPEEGGGFRGSENERVELIRKAAELHPAYVDVELRTLNGNPSLRTSSLGKRTIVSWHDLCGTPDRQRLASIASEASATGGVPKIVPTALTGEDNLRVLSLYDGPGPAPVAFCMGRPGVFSRVMAMERGTPISYASLDGDLTAEGQLPISQALAIRRRLEDE